MDGRAATGPMRSKRRQLWFCHLAANTRLDLPRGHKRLLLFGTSPGKGQDRPDARRKTRGQLPGQVAAKLFPPAWGSLVFPCGSGVKNPPQCRRRGFNPWVRTIPWRRKWQPTPVSLLGKPHGQRAWWAILHGVTKSWTRLRD